MDRDGPDRLIRILDVDDGLSRPSDGPNYWNARAILEVARQLERLEATIRTAFMEWCSIDRERNSRT